MADDIHTSRRRLLEAVLQQSPVGMVVVDTAGRTVLANDHARALLNNDPVETSSVADFARFTAVHPDGRPFSAEDYSVARALRGVSVVDEEINFVRSDGERRVFNVSASPVYDESGKIVAAVNSFFDVTDKTRENEMRRLQLEAERSARSEFEVSNRAKDEFLAMLGHELRNPLAPIRTALELMELRGDQGSQRERAIISRHVAHLVRLVDDLLDVARIARGNLMLHPETVSVKDIVTRAIETASPLFEERRHTLSVDVPPDLRVTGDEVRLAQVVANVLHNAAKYTDPAGSVAIHAQLTGADIVLRVKDNGAGIDAGMLPRVFDIFTQSKQTSERSRGGLGLGLAIVKNLVELHGGSVRAESAGIDRGTEIIISLPAAPSGSGPTRRAPGPGAARDAHGQRVLVVDDNVDAARLLGEVLTVAGHDVVVVHDGPDALRVAARQHFDAAVLDIGLPVMDGHELAHRLRVLPGLERLLLVALTGYGQDADRALTKASGFHHHLVKPVDVEALRKVLAAARAPA